MKIDLHNHTNHSDGVFTPRELIAEAKRQNVDVFALTDHDNVFGIEEIKKEIKDFNDIYVIPGIELSTFYKGENVHIVCLFKNGIIPDSMYEFSLKNKENRKTRAIKMMNNIKEIYGLKIDMDLLFSTGEVITRGNMLRNLVIANNMSFEEAKFYISSDSKAYIPSSKLETKDGLALAKAANAVCIFAHPCLVKREYIDEILSFGFDGIEVYYPANKLGDEEYFKAKAKEYDLMWSAGSDCHGDKSHANIGTCYLNEEEFKPLAKAIGFRLEDLKWL